MAQLNTYPITVDTVVRGSLIVQATKNPNGSVNTLSLLDNTCSPPRELRMSESQFEDFVEMVNELRYGGK